MKAGYMQSALHLVIEHHVKGDGFSGTVAFWRLRFLKHKRWCILSQTWVLLGIQFVMIVPQEGNHRLLGPCPAKPSPFGPLSTGSPKPLMSPNPANRASLRTGSCEQCWPFQLRSFKATVTLLSWNGGDCNLMNNKLRESRRQWSKKHWSLQSGRMKNKRRTDVKPRRYETYSKIEYIFNIILQYNI